MNVFYNGSTWADQLDEYDWLYLANSAGSAQAFSSAVGPVSGGGLLCGLLGLLC